MDLNSALDIIIKDLREAREIISDLSNYKGVPAFQVELAKAKCKSAEDIITLLKTIYPLKGEESEEVYSTAGSPDKKQATVSVDKRGVMVEPVRASTDTPPVADKPLIVSTDTPPVADEPLIVSADTPPAADEPLIVSADTPPVAEKPLIVSADTPPVADEPLIVSAGTPPIKGDSVPPASAKEPRLSGKRPAGGQGEAGSSILADRFGEVEKRVNEKMHGRRSDDDISSRIKHSPINNLADAIGINDKFYFTREIFGGNSDSYRDAINRLNNASGIREAEGIIKECGSIEVNSEAVRELLALVKRKTGSDE